MHSRARLTYNQVWDWLSQPKTAKGADAQALRPHLENVYALYKVLAAARARRGAIDFETIELALEFDTRGKIEAIVPVVRNEAHKLIEDCMLAANVCTAEYLLEKKHPRSIATPGRRLQSLGAQGSWKRGSGAAANPRLGRRDALADHAPVFNLCDCSIAAMRRWLADDVRHGSVKVTIVTI
jgi:hypothetical protein